MDQRLQDPAMAAPPDWRGLCEELFEALDGWHKAVFETGTGWVRPDETYLLDRARTALAQAEPEVVGPTRRQLMLLADDMDMASVSDAAEYARAVLARWGRPAPVPAGERQAAPVPVAVSERLPELRGMFERILCVARSSGQKPVGNIELADRLIKAVVSWGALPLPSGEVEA